MKEKPVDILIKKEFDFLLSEFNFILDYAKEFEWGWKFFFADGTTGIEITYEIKEAYLFIVFYRLEQEMIAKDTVDYSRSLNVCSLDHLILFKNPSALIKPAYQYGNNSVFYSKGGLEKYIAKFADILKKYANDVLMGDFSSFKNVKKMLNQEKKT